MKVNNLVIDYNYNNKLDCDCFTVIRPLNLPLFTPGNQIELYLRDQPLGQVEVLMHRSLAEDKLNDWITYLDLGYNFVDGMKMLRRQFPSRKPQVTYSWALLKYIRRHDAESFLRGSVSKKRAIPLMTIAV